MIQYRIWLVLIYPLKLGTFMSVILFESFLPTVPPPSSPPQVLISVVLTVVDVWGFSYYVGLTLEICPSINLILSCGLALDYAAHVGVAYVCSRETKRKGNRTRDSVTANTQTPDPLIQFFCI